MRSIKKIVAKVVATCAVIMLISPMTCFAADDEILYVIDTSITGYGCYVGTALTTAATAQQKSALNHMRKRALIEWTFKNDSEPYYFQKISDGVLSNRFVFSKEIENYRGVLYQQKKYNLDAPLEGSREHWLQDRTAIVSAVNYMLNNNKQCVRGTDCSSSVVYAWRSAINGNNRSNGVLMLPKSCHDGRYCSAYTTKTIVSDGNDKSATKSYGNYVDRVGQYGKVADNLSSYGNDTKKILTALRKTGNFTNNADVYTRVYSKMQPGDFLVKYYNKGTEQKPKYAGHARLIEQVKIIKKTDGTINPDASYVVVTEQLGGKLSYTDVNLDKDKIYYTTWRVRAGETIDGQRDSLYTFKYLAENDFYLPYRYNGNTTSPVAAVTAESGSASSVDLNWAEIETDCDGYELLYSEDASFTDAEKIVIDNSSETGTTIDGLDSNSEYYVKMRSYCIKEDGEKEYSDYNNWIKVAPGKGILYRENAPSRKAVSSKVYSDYIKYDIPYDDDEYDFEECCEYADEPAIPFHKLINLEVLK